LWDLRGHDYSAFGWAAVAGWIGLLSLGAIAAAKDRERWPVWALALSWIVFNIGLHAYWQFRDSVFLYAPHPHIALFLMVVAGAVWARRGPRYGNMLYGAVLTVVTVLVGLNNLPIYLGLSALN
jgi:hypothetical protein